MGVDNFIKNMPPGLKKLYLNIFSVVTILMMVYGALTFVLSTFVEGHGFLFWFSTPAFTTVVVVLVFVMIGTKILKGGQIKVPEQKGPKKEFTFPDTWGVKKYKEGGGGAQFHPPQQQQTNWRPPPNVWQQQNQKPIYQNQPPAFHPPPNVYQPQQAPTGSWTCKNCGFMVVGSNVCPRCGGQYR